MSRQVSPSMGRVYGLLRVTRIWGMSRATVYRHRGRADEAARKKPGPLGALSDEDLIAAIRQRLRDSPFHGEGYPASCGRGCALPAFAPAAVMSCGSCGRTTCWPLSAPAGHAA